MPTDEEWLKFRKAVIKRLREQQQAIDDLWERVNTDDGEHRQLVDEAVEKAERAQRAMRRLKKEFDDHEHEDE